MTILSPAPVPSGLVSWWRGEGNALDFSGANNGALVENTTYGTGEVGMAFVFDGNGDEVLIGNPANLQSQNFTVEMWVKRASATIVGQEAPVLFWTPVTYGPRYTYANLFAYGANGYAVGIKDDGTTYLSKCGVSEWDSGSIADANWHHLAVTYTNGVACIYVDGMTSGPTNYGATFAFTNSAAIGRSDSAGVGFFGSIDEVSVYNRALSAAEVQAICGAGPAGKVAPPVAPWFFSQPGSISVNNGCSGAFSATVLGTLPISYQWYFNATNPLAGATNATLTLNIVSDANAGAYSLVASNAGGLSTSAVVNLGVIPTAVQPSSAAVTNGGTASFSVSNFWTFPVTYQWYFNATNLLAGATNATLTISNASTASAGGYSVVLSNAVWVATSSVAVLSVLPAWTPTIPPSGLVGFWRGDGNALDSAGTNNGTLVADTTYGVGEVGQAFVFDGVGDKVTVGNPPQLQLQNFTIEMWVKRASAARSTLDTNYVNTNSGPLSSYYGINYTLANLFGYCDHSSGGYVVGITDGGSACLSQSGGSKVYGGAITDTNWHYLAVTYTNGTAGFFVDGASAGSGALGATFSFTTPATISGFYTPKLYSGYSICGDAGAFYGSIDEVGVYNRALSASEIGAIYSAGQQGTITFPLIGSQPTNVVVTNGATASFAVSASGSPSMSYQWYFNATNLLAGATNATLTIGNASIFNIGGYSVVVSNTLGTVTSAVANLTVVSPGIQPPSGLVSLWRGDGNALDSVGTNHGVWVGNPFYAPGVDGQAFVFNGIGDEVLVGNPPGLQLQTFTIEAWVQRANASAVALYGDTNACVFGYGAGGYLLGLNNNGAVFLGSAVTNAVNGAPITDTNWHHIAATYTSGTARIYVDGVSSGALSLSRTFIFGASAAIGMIDNGGCGFAGSIDELSVYSRVLSDYEVLAVYNAGQQGKFTPLAAPIIAAQPADASATNGGTVAFAVAVAGAQPLSFQWYFNGATPLGGATNARLALNGVSAANAGAYSVIVSNPLGTAASSNAQLTLVQTLPQTNLFGQAADAPNILGWRTGGFAPWKTDTNYATIGAVSLRAGNLNYTSSNSAPVAENSWIQATVQGPGTLTFDRAIEGCGLHFFQIIGGSGSSPISVSYPATLAVYLDGMSALSVSTECVTNLQTGAQTLWVPAGAHAIRWNWQARGNYAPTNTLTAAYYDSWSVVGSFDAWLDNVAFSNAPTLSLTPAAGGRPPGIKFASDANTRYQVQHTTNLAAPWVDDDLIDGTGEDIALTNAPGTNNAIFYRLKITR